MGEGLKRVAKICGGITVKAKGKTVEYNSEGVKKGPYGCKCQTLHHKLSGDGCDECNPELAKELSECEVESCSNEAEYYDEMDNCICKEHMEQDIEEQATRLLTTSL